MRSHFHLRNFALLIYLLKKIISCLSGFKNIIPGKKKINIKSKEQIHKSHTLKIMDQEDQHASLLFFSSLQPISEQF